MKARLAAIVAILVMGVTASAAQSISPPSFATQEEASAWCNGYWAAASAVMRNRDHLASLAAAGRPVESHDDAMRRIYRREGAAAPSRAPDTNILDAVDLYVVLPGAGIPLMVQGAGTVMCTPAAPQARPQARR